MRAYHPCTGAAGQVDPRTPWPTGLAKSVRPGSVKDPFSVRWRVSEKDPVNLCPPDACTHIGTCMHTHRNMQAYVHHTVNSTQSPLTGHTSSAQSPMCPVAVGRLTGHVHFTGCEQPHSRLPAPPALLVTFQRNLGIKTN